MFIASSLKNSQNFFITSLPLYISWYFSMLLKKYCRHWKTWWNMFTYFWCKWIFRIIFTSINLFYSTLKISINNKCCFIRFLILTKLKYFSVFRMYSNVRKKLFLRLKFFFCNERMKAIQPIKSSLKHLQDV